MKKLSVIVCLFMFALMPLLAQVKQTVAVLGDSYSTFEGFIPKGHHLDLRRNERQLGKCPYRQLPVQQLEACRPLLFPSSPGEIAFRSPSAPSECRYLLHSKFRAEG